MKKILILYENVGSGHKRVTTILETIFSEVEGYEVVSYTVSELFNDRTTHLVEKLWSYWLRRNWMRLTDNFINFFLRGWVAPVVEALQSSGYLDKVAEVSPDMIICTYDSLGKLLGTYAKQHSIPFYMVITEVAVFTDLVNPEAVHICYFPETINAIRNFSFATTYFSVQLDHNTSTLGKIKYVFNMYKETILFFRQNSIYRNVDRVYPEHNQANCVAVGPIVDPIYYEPQDKLAMRQKYEINRDHPCLLVVSGSIGGEYLYEMVRLFQETYDQELTILAVCGKDSVSYQKITTIKGKKANIQVIPFGFVDHLNELFAATDVILARPSAGVILEALTSHIPLITSARTLSNDAGNVEIIKKYRLGEVYQNTDEIIDLFTQIMTDHQSYIDHITNFLAPYPADFAGLKQSILNIMFPQSHSL